MDQLNLALPDLITNRLASRRLSRRAALAAGAGVVALGLGHTSLAQDNDDSPLGMNSIGDPVTIYNAEGDEAAKVTVLEIVDPFEDFSEYGEPGRGERYLLISITIENSGKRPYEFEPYDFGVLDSLGRLYTIRYVPRSDESTVENPDLEGASMLPGEEVRGALSYSVPEDAKLVQSVYTFYDDVQQLYLLADLNAEEGSSADD